MHKHEINLESKYRTNLIDEITHKKINSFKNTHISKNIYNEKNYSTIYFKDITDSYNYHEVKEQLKKVLKKYLLKSNKYLIIGLGNKSCTFDSLGPKTLDNILTTNYLKKEKLDTKFKLVSKFSPDVEGNTGIENFSLIKKIVEIEKPNQIILIDSLISSNIANITKCIQITNSGIDHKNTNHNYKKSLNEKNLKCKVTLIGIPTILETNYSNTILTTKDIDFFIKKSSQLIGESLNEVIHNYNFSKDVPL